jgi:glycosyltransferase involved in cell wall biosynthesis
VLPSARGGGAERVLLNLVQRFNRDLFSLHLVLIQNSGPYLNLVPQDVQFHALGYDRVGKAILKLAVVLRRVKPAVVMSSIGHLNLALLLLRPFLAEKTKIIIRESNMPSKSFSSGAKFTIFRLLYPLLYPSADQIVCPGKAIKNELKMKFRIRENKMVTIPNAVLVDTIRSKMMSHRNPFKQARFNLMAAGSLTQQKGFDLLVKAMKKLIEIRKGVHLTIIGEGPEKMNLQTQIHSLNLSASITLAGYQENPYPYFYYADLFVLPSRWEGLPNVVLESLACGTPVVAFNCPGCVSEIFDNPSQGILVKAGDVEALADVIDMFFEKRKYNSKHSLLPDKFDVNAVISKYQDVLS